MSYRDGSREYSRQRDRDYDRHDRREHEDRRHEYDDRHHHEERKYDRSDRDDERERRSDRGYERRDQRAVSQEHYGNYSDQKQEGSIVGHSPPSNVLIFKHLGAETTEERLWQALAGWAVTAVRIIRNRETGYSREFAFVDFVDVENAVAFMETSGGKVSLDNAKVVLDYTQNTPVPEKKADWLCVVCQTSNFSRRTECFNCHTARAPDAPPTEASASIVVKNLNPNTLEFIIQNTFQTMAPVKGVRLVRDRVTNRSKGVAYVSFHTEADAQRVLATMGGLRIDDRTVHGAIALAKSAEEKQKIIDERRQAEEYLRNYGKPVAAPPPVPVAPTPTVVMAKPTSAQPKYEPPQFVAPPPVPVPEPPAPTELAASAKPVKLVIKAPVATISKASASMLQKWNQKAAELKQAAAEEENQPKPSKMKMSKNKGLAAPMSFQHSEALPAPTKFIPVPTPSTPSAATTTSSSVADALPSFVKPAEVVEANNKFLCLLCKRQFNSADMLQKHEQLSDLHRRNVEVARAREEEFRREKEKDDADRRIQDQMDRLARRDASAAKNAPPVNQLGADNVGNRMMQKMGWSQGEGLGRSGLGMIGPIEVSVRSERAGLGMQDAGVDPTDTYAEAARKKARARFMQQMDDEQDHKSSKTDE